MIMHTTYSCCPTAMRYAFRKLFYGFAIAFALLTFFKPMSAWAEEDEDCRYGDTGSSCPPGGWGDGPSPQPSAPKSPPPVDRSVDLSPYWSPMTEAPPGISFSTPGGGRGAPVGTPQVLISAQEARLKAGKAVAKAIRPEGACYRPGPAAKPHVKPFPKGTTFYLALDPTSKVDANAWGLLKTTLLTDIDNANQYFGRQPATSLAGQTAADDGFDPPNYGFYVYDSPAEAQAASDADHGSKLVVHVTDYYDAPAGGSIEMGQTETGFNKDGVAISATIRINFNFIDVLRSIMAERGATPFDAQLVNTMLVNNWMIDVIPHELFGHLALMMNHVTFDKPVDDDHSILVYGGNRMDALMSGTPFVPPVSYCDMVLGWGSRS